MATIDISIYQQLKDAGVKGIYLHGDTVLAAPRLEDLLNNPIVKQNLVAIFMGNTILGPGYHAGCIDTTMYRGSTPFEAVARLLLAKKIRM